MLKEAETTDINLPSGVTSFQKSPRFFWLALLLILLLAAALRLYALGDYPQAFNQDEMVLGYDAWSVWTTGKDQHGNTLPIHFRTFNDSVPPVANYIAAPFVGLLGLSRFSTTLPFALLGILTVGLVALLARHWWGSWPGLVAALLLALDPWHLTYSRVAYPASLVPLFTTLALYTFTRAMNGLKAETSWPKRRQAYGWLAASAASFALLAASYTPLKLESPLLVGLAGLSAFGWFWRHRLVALGWLSFCGLCSSPLLYSQLRYWNQIQGHFKHISITDEPNWLPTFVGQYLSHYNPLALFVIGFKGGMSVRPAGVGELFWLEGFLWLAAAVGLWQNRHSFKERLGFNLPLLLAGWFLTFPISSSLTNVEIPHEVRAYNFVPLPQLLAGYGAIVLFQKLSGVRWGRFKPVYGLLAGGVVTLLVFQNLFLPAFFSRPLLETTTAAADMPYNTGQEPVIQKVAQLAGPCDSVWIEPGNQTYIYYLFETRYPPEQFQKLNFETSTRNGGWLYVPYIDNIHFGIPGREPDTAPKLPGCTTTAGRLYFASHTVPTGPEWQELLAVRNQTGQAVWRLVVHR